MTGVSERTRSTPAVRREAPIEPGPRRWFWHTEFTRAHVVGIAVLVLLVILVTIDVIVRGPLTRLDAATLAWVHAHSHGPLRETMRVMSWVGDRWVVSIPLGVFSVLLAWRHRSLRPMMIAALTCILLAIVVPGMKLIIGRTSPVTGHDAVFAGGDQFPSGHSANGIVLWGLTIEYLAAMGRPIARFLTRRRRRALAICSGLAAGIGMIGIGGHWVSDVLAGWPLGAAVYILALRFPPGALADRTELLARPAGVGLRRRPRAWRNPYAEPD